MKKTFNIFLSNSHCKQRKTETQISKNQAFQIGLKFLFTVSSSVLKLLFMILLWCDFQVSNISVRLCWKWGRSSLRWSCPWERDPPRKPQVPFGRGGERGRRRRQKGISVYMHDAESIRRFFLWEIVVC